MSKTHQWMAIVICLGPVSSLFAEVSSTENKPVPETRSVYDEGFWFLGPDDKLRIGTSTQLDSRFDLGGPANSTFQIRRARLYATGVVEEKWGYMVMGRWDRGSTNLHFAWLESQHFPFARLRVGLFKQPYSIEGTNSDHYFDFNERSLWLANLNQLEDVGVMIYGKLLEERFEYGIGVFNGRGREKDDSNESKEITVQTVFAPFRASELYWLKGLNLSFSIAHTQLENDLKDSSYTSAAQTKFWTYNAGVVPKGNKDRMSGELEWLMGPASLKGGLHRAKFNKLEVGAQTSDLTVDGWLISGSYLLTGERKPRNRAVVPEQSLDPKKGGWGALEAVARYEQFYGDRKAFDEGFFTGTPRVESYTLGLNWYLNRHMKLLATFQKSLFADLIMVNGSPIRYEQTINFRLQFDL